MIKCVYIHKLDNVPFYIGYGSKERAYNLYSRKRRWLEYVKDRRKDVQIEIIKWFNTAEEAKSYEIYLQKELRKEGYPIVGLIGNYHDKEQDTLQTAKTRGRHLTDEQKKHVSDGVKKGMSKPEVKAKLGKHCLGKQLSEERKRKISEGMKRYKEMERRLKNE